MANHTFTPKTDNIHKCSVCSRSENTHGLCECCPNNDTLVKFKTMMMCPDCYQKELALTQKSELEANNRVAHMNDVVRQSQSIDSQVQVRTDLFNSHTIAIAELKSAIDADEAITNKPYELAKVLLERFNHFKSVAFDLQEKLVDTNNGMKAIQVHLNTMANQLRTEEREALKLQDINYKPNEIKTVKVKEIKKPVKPYSKADVDKVSKETGLPAHTLMGLCIAKNISAEAAANLIKVALANKSN